jgi:hypothetical protein
MAACLACRRLPIGSKMRADRLVLKLTCVSCRMQMRFGRRTQRTSCSSTCEERHVSDALAFRLTEKLFSSQSEGRKKEEPLKLRGSLRARNGPPNNG